MYPLHVAAKVFKMPRGNYSRKEDDQKGSDSRNPVQEGGCFLTWTKAGNKTAGRQQQTHLPKKYFNIT